MLITANRRWLRFSLRTLFVVVTLLGVWLGYYVNWHAQRNAVLRLDDVTLGTLVLHDEPLPLPWPLEMLGASSVNQGIFLPNGTTDEELHRVRRLFPESLVVRW